MAEQQMEGGPSPDEIVQNVAETIGALANAAAQQRPDVAKKLQQIQNDFMQIMSEFVGGGAKGAPGGRSQAMPDQSNGMPMGPQGAI
jgi:hypothetical protein